MNKILAAGISAIALVSAAAPAHAATDLGSIDITSNDILSDPFKFLAQVAFGQDAMTAGDYVIHYTFSFPLAGAGAGDFSSSLVGGDNTIFNSVDLNGSFFGLTNGDTQAKLVSGPVLASPTLNQVNVAFKVLNDGPGTFTGSVSATALPEPSTWAMMLLGFGVIGYAMRRRRAEVTSRVHYSMA